MLNKLRLYFFTIRYLTLIQIRYRIYYFFRGKIRRFIRFSYKSRKPEGVEKLKLEVSLNAAPSVWYQDNKFSFLYLEKEFKSEIDWNEAIYGKLWTYNLNYFEFLHTPNISKKEGILLIKDFIKQIQTSKDGLEPYPISLRAVHWIKFLTYNNIRDSEIDQSLYNQLWTLVDKREYHILGNHLLENGFGLLFGAYYFNDNNLYQIAKNILIKELHEQVLADGAHFELSPMYHQLMLYRVFDCYNLVKNNTHFNQELLPLFKTKAEIMLSWLEQMTFKNGDIPLLNDSAFNINPTTEQLSEYAQKLSIQSSIKPLKESGYRKISHPNYECIIDIGHIGPNYIPGHAHSDTFSFVLYSKGEPFIIDRGISTYNPNERRKIERSTSAHNTVKISKYEQSEMWASFRVARRTYPKIIQDTPNLIEASLDFATNKNLMHHRKFLFKKGKMVIIDNIKGAEIGKAYLHFHPKTSIKLESNKIISNQGVIHILGATDIFIEKYEYAHSFNQLIKAQRTVIYFSKSITTTIHI